MPPCPRLHSGPRVVPQFASRWSHGNEVKRCLGQHHHENWTLDFPHISHLHSLPNRGACQRSCVENVKMLPLSKRGLTSPRQSCSAIIGTDYRKFRQDWLGGMRGFRPEVGSPVGITRGRWIGCQKNQVFRLQTSTTAAPGTAPNQPGLTRQRVATPSCLFCRH